MVPKTKILANHKILSRKQPKQHSQSQHSNPNSSKNPPKKKIKSPKHPMYKNEGGSTSETKNVPSAATVTFFLTVESHNNQQQGKNTKQEKNPQQPPTAVTTATLLSVNKNSINSTPFCLLFVALPYQPSLPPTSTLGWSRTSKTNPT